MSKQYDEYIKKHQKAVRQGFGWLSIYLPGLIEEWSDMMMVDIIRNHDVSKYSSEEYDAYDRYFYGEGEKTKEVKDAFNRAWLHHIHANPHHWQHWVLINDDPNLVEIVLEMDYPYIIEMICDWWAFSWVKGDLYEIFKWWEEHEKYMKLHVKTRKTVVDILEKINDKLDELKEMED